VTLVVVDAENVRRSLWPNLSREELVRRARAWAAREGHELLIVFDGAPPEDAPDLLGSRDADDAIAGLELGSPWWLVSSDRGLRGRVSPERVIGGGTFARMI
jgi:GAF domain-containing protein